MKLFASSSCAAALRRGRPPRPPRASPTRRSPHIVVTANQVDIDAGKLAASMATNAEVKKFGQQMVTDHTGVNKQADRL